MGHPVFIYTVAESEHEYLTRTRTQQCSIEPDNTVYHIRPETLSLKHFSTHLDIISYGSLNQNCT